MYGRLTAVGFHHYDHNSKQYWLFKCSCGNEKILFKNHVVCGLTNSCGCISVEGLRKRSTKHGEASRGTKTHLYLRWEAMWNRCRHVENYKDRTPVKRWQIYTNFARDMSASFEAHVEIHGLRDTTLDRINNKKRYSKGNCRWATFKIQANNK